MHGRDKLLRQIDLIYEAAVDMRGWMAALTAIGGTLGAPAASLTITDPDGKNAPFHVAAGIDPQWARIFADRWSATNIVRERGLALPSGAIYQFEDLMPRAEFERTTMYNEWFEPQRQNHMLAANAAKSAAGSAGVCFYRASISGRFDAGEMRLLEMLKPHLQRAIALNLRFGHLCMERDSAVEMLNRCAHGALLVDSGARVLFANKAAEALLTASDGLRAKEGGLTAATPTKTMELRALIARGRSGIPGGLIPLPCRDGHSLTALVLPLRAETAWVVEKPSAIVFVTDPIDAPLPSLEGIRSLFTLTAAQAALAREIIRGDGIDAAAQRLGISRNTARTHLTEIFQRTGTTRQAELVRLIMQHSLPVARHPEETEAARPRHWRSG